MIESLNRLVTDYSGVFVLLSLLLGLSTIYFYFNPRRPKFRIRYKMYSKDMFSTGWALGQGIKRELIRRGPPTYFVDVWNAGNEPITADVMRKEVTIALQSAVVAKGVSIERSEIEQETHPGVSGFQLVTQDGSRQLTWRHFDPGMCVRIRLELNKSIGADSLTVFGEGRGLGLKKGQVVSEMRGPLAWLHQTFIFTIPVVAAAALAGWIVQWLGSSDLTGPLAMLAGFGLIVIALLMFIGMLLLGTGLNRLVELLVNSRSPLEKIAGTPSAEPTREEMMEYRRAGLLLPDDPGE